VSPLAIDHDLLQRFGELLPRADLTNAHPDLVEQALAVEHQVTKQKEGRDVLLAVVGPRVPPRLRQIGAVGFRPLLECRRQVLERPESESRSDVGRTEEADVGRGVRGPGGHVLLADGFPGGLLPLNRDIRILGSKLFLDLFLRQVPRSVAERREVAHVANRGRGAATLLRAKCLLHRLAAGGRGEYRQTKGPQNDRAARAQKSSAAKDILEHDPPVTAGSRRTPERSAQRTLSLLEPAVNRGCHSPQGRAKSR